MEFIKKSYYYFFYRIYRSIEYTSELSGGKFLTEYKAGLVMLALETWGLFSLANYYTVYEKISTELSISMPIVYVPAVIVYAFNYLTIHYKDRWKQYNTEFANYSKKKNRIGGWIVFGIILLIISNLIFSFYLMGEVDWSKYR
ncbi:hypothetical protein GJU43_22665 [Flavobacterium sp. LC2016-23]|uniref:hypothetical protein n=1 Tax=Flavobacterium sp. LC2016-23 TaxID=2666330 RepID=UPI0012AF7C88|nr:hypothetical protein [Flavobacterium sp. LC2016-23]MRX42083.1 hypothetical protein [Flavobacterium sp. LC2016-23]